MQNVILEHPWAWRYGTEKIAQATIEMLMCRTNVRQKFAEVYEYHLLHICEENVPLEIWRDIQELRRDMVQYDHPRFGAAWASAQRMHHSKLNKYIRRLGEWMWIITTASATEEHK